MIPIRDDKSGATFAVKVHPRARKDAITGILGDALKVSLTAPPAEGRANDACIEFLDQGFAATAFLRYHSRRPHQPEQSGADFGPLCFSGGGAARRRARLIFGHSRLDTPY